MSSLLTKEMVAEAIKLATPSILAAMESGVFKRGDLHIVVMNPSSNVDDNPDDTILHEHSFGDVDAWESDYSANAVSKAQLAWKHGRSTREIVTCAPHLLAHGDIVYAGGVWFDDIAVGVSGIQSEFDEAIAYTIAAFCKALAIQKMQNVVLPSKVSFIGGALPDDS